MNDNDTLADDLRKDSLALMKLLADEKHKSEALTAELAMLSDKACAAVVAYRAALGKLTDGFKYPTEVVTIARNALAPKAAETPASKPPQFDCGTDPENIECINCGKGQGYHFQSADGNLFCEVPQTETNCDAAKDGT